MLFNRQRPVWKSLIRLGCDSFAASSHRRVEMPRSLDLPEQVLWRPSGIQGGHCSLSGKRCCVRSCPSTAARQNWLSTTWPSHSFHVSVIIFTWLVNPALLYRSLGYPRFWLSGVNYTFHLMRRMRL